MNYCSFADFSTPISKVNFAQHVTALHARSDEGFEVEYQVRLIVLRSEI